MTKVLLKNESDVCFTDTKNLVNTLADLIDEVNNGTVNVTEIS